MASNCQISTPEQYVDKLLDDVGYIKHIYDKSFLENSCGEGNILRGAVRRYIKSALSEGYSDEEIKKGLENHFVAYDTDPECVIRCIQSLNSVVEEFGLFNVNWNVTQCDYLKCKAQEYDYIVGNPPYITYHDLTEEQRAFLRLNFSSCKKGRFDYCYAFIEAGIRDLSPAGKLAYIIPYSILRNKFAESTRNLIKSKLTKLTDYKGIEVFPSIVTSSISIICDSQGSDGFEYENVFFNKTTKMKKDTLQEEWIWETTNEGERKFGDYFKVSNSIATLLNKAFIFDIDKFDEDFYYVKQYKIEKNIVYSAISAKTCKSNKGAHPKRKGIIFPYSISGSKLDHYDEIEFRKLYPECFKYLQQFSEELLNRKVNPGVKWFEYGRTQGIQHVFEDKLVFSLVITNSINLYDADSRSIPYAGAYIRVKPNSGMTLEKAREILQTKEFLSYVKSKGTPTTTTSYRLSVKDIEEYKF